MKNQANNPLEDIFKQALFSEFYGYHLFEKELSEYYFFQSRETGDSVWLIPSQSQEHLYEARLFKGEMKRPSLYQASPRAQPFEHYVCFDKLMLVDRIRDVKKLVEEGGTKFAREVNRCFMDVLLNSVSNSPVQTQDNQLDRFLAEVADELAGRNYDADRLLFPRGLKNRFLLELIEQDDDIQNAHYVGTTTTGLKAFWSTELPDNIALIFDSTAGLVITQEPRFWSGESSRRAFHIEVGGQLDANLVVKDVRAIIPIAIVEPNPVKARTFVSEISCLLDRGNGDSDETLYFANRSHESLVEEFRSYLEMHRLLIGMSHLEITQALNDRGTDLLLQREDYKIGFQIKSHYDVSESNFSTNVKRQLADSQAHGLDKWYLLICSPLQYEGQDYSGKINHLLNEISTYKTNYPEAYGPRNTIKYFNNATSLSKEGLTLQSQ